MAIILESCKINSPELGKAVAIELAEGLDELHLDFMDTQWAPALQRQYDLGILQFFQLPAADRTVEKLAEVFGKLDVQDQHWNWRGKCRVAAGTNRRIFSLLNAGAVEAAMLILLGENSRGPVTALPIVYVDYLAVAPWNRTAFQDPRRFRGLGRVMIGAAVELSRTLGFDGRCGLHSLPQSEGFYRQIGMRDFGLDTAKQLRYFEFDGPAAQRFRQ